MSKLPGYRVNDIDTLRDKHVEALEEIAKEEVIYFAGKDEEFERCGRELEKANKDATEAEKLMLAQDSFFRKDKYFIKYDNKVKRTTALKAKHAKLLDRQDQIRTTAKRIEDIVTDFGFEKRTITPPEENSIDYVIYTRERDGHVDVLADRDLRTKKIGMQLFRIPEEEFDEWYEALLTGNEHALEVDKQDKRGILGTRIGGVLGLIAVTYALTLYYDAPSDIISRGWMDPAIYVGGPAIGALFVWMSGCIGSRFNYLDSKRIAKGSKALLHKSIQEQFAPKYRVPEEYAADSNDTEEEGLEKLTQYVAMNAALIRNK